jgi:hypothetical protein
MIAADVKGGEEIFISDASHEIGVPSTLGKETDRVGVYELDLVVRCKSDNRSQHAVQ